MAQGLQYYVRIQGRSLAVSKSLGIIEAEDGFDP